MMMIMMRRLQSDPIRQSTTSRKEIKKPGKWVSCCKCDGKSFQIDPTVKSHLLMGNAPCKYGF